MRSYAVEGIRLDLKVDAYPVSVNVAMPTGLVVNELLTNALKHAFTGRDRGTITLHSLVDSTGCAWWSQTTVSAFRPASNGQARKLGA